jgi:RimJ/RimL family protein N-acetyltransferase
MYQTPRKIDREQLLQELKTGEDTGNYHLYGVFDKSNDLCIGNIRVGMITHVHKISDLAIFIGNPEYLGKGLATEAINLGNQLCFGPYDFRKLHGGMFEENIASVKAYMKTGWVVEGRLRAQYWVNEKPMDRITVACFNPKYFSSEFLKTVKEKSEIHLKDLISY